MNVAARRWAVGALGTIAALTALPASPADAANGEWQILRWSVEPGDVVAGEVWTITGIISAPEPGDIITDLELTLTRVDDGRGDVCPGLTEPLHVREGYPGDLGEGGDPTSSTTSTTALATTTTAPLTGADRYRFRFDVTPLCNGHYQLAVVGTADRAVGEGDTSDPLPMGDPSDDDNAVEVNLRPPDVANTTAAVGGDRAIAVVWQTDDSYSAGPPPDFVGYGIDYSVDGGNNWKNGALAEPNAHTAAIAVPASDPAGDYQVRVRGVRKNAAGTLEPALVASGGATAIATVAVGEPPPPTTASPPTTRRGPTGRGVPGPGGGPTTTVDEGFEPELDYSDLEEGDEEATLPDDASSFLDSVPTPGSAILVPFAIAECLAVWAFHLRLLARRLDAVEPLLAIPVEPFQPGRNP